MARLDWMLVTLLCAAPLSSAEIFKCADKSGLDRYQNFPCAIDSIAPSAPVSSPPTSPSDAQTLAKPAPIPAAKPAAIPFAAEATVAQPVAAVMRAGTPRPGMTDAEVREIWGEPDEVIQDEPRDGRIEIWRYGGGRSVQFSNKRRVLIVDR